MIRQPSQTHEAGAQCFSKFEWLSCHSERSEESLRLWFIQAAALPGQTKRDPSAQKAALRMTRKASKRIITRRPAGRSGKRKGRIAFRPRPRKHTAKLNAPLTTTFYNLTRSFTSS